MHITFVRVGANVWIKTLYKTLFPHLFFFTLLFLLLYSSLSFFVACLSYFVSFFILLFPPIFYLLLIPVPSLIPILYCAVQNEDKDLFFSLLVWNKKEICVFLKPWLCCSGSRYVKFTHQLLHTPCLCRMTAISQPCWPYHVNNRLNNECYWAFKSRARGSLDITVCILSAFRPVSFETDIAFCIAVSNNCIKRYHIRYRQYVLHFAQSVLIRGKRYLGVGGRR